MKRVCFVLCYNAVMSCVCFAVPVMSARCSMVFMCADNVLLNCV